MLQLSMYLHYVYVRIYIHTNVYQSDAFRSSRTTNENDYIHYIQTTNRHRLYILYMFIYSFFFSTWIDMPRIRMRVCVSIRSVYM